MPVHGIERIHSNTARILSTCCANKSVIFCHYCDVFAAGGWIQTEAANIERNNYRPYVGADKRACLPHALPWK